MTKERYEATARFFDEHKGWAGALRLVCRLLTIFVYIFFVGLIAWEVVRAEYRTAFEIVLVCGIGLLGCTVLRTIINSPRPYEVYGCAPTIKRDKSGCSFPSRHSFSIAIIAVAAMRVSPPAGAVLAVLSVLLAATRVLGGVHFIKDVVGGIALAALWGFMGFWITAVI